MIDGVNDTDEQAEKLAPIARRLRAHVNLIPLNATPLSVDQPATPDRIRSFVRILRLQGIKVTVRDTRGKDIDAACGQLAAAEAVTFRASCSANTLAGS